MDSRALVNLHITTFWGYFPPPFHFSFHCSNFLQATATACATVYLHTQTHAHIRAGMRACLLTSSHTNQTYAFSVYLQIFIRAVNAIKQMYNNTLAHTHIHLLILCIYNMLYVFVCAEYLIVDSLWHPPVEHCRQIVIYA